MSNLLSHTIKIAKIVLFALVAIWSLPVSAEQDQTQEQVATKTTVQRWTLNQQNADIREFIAQIASITGKSFVLDPRIKSGNSVSVVSTRPMTKEQIYDIFLEVLSANGFSVVPKGDTNTIVANTQVKTTGAITTEEKRATATLVTQVIDLHSVSAVEVIPIIRPLVAQYGHAAASASGNAVIVSDHKSNVDRITKLVRELDEASSNDYEVLDLKHVWVGDLAKLIQDTLTSSKGLPSSLQVIADERSNRLVIKGNVNKRAKVRKLVETLDRQGVRDSSTRVIFLRYGDARNIADMLNEATGALTQESVTGDSSHQNIATGRGNASKVNNSNSKNNKSKSKSKSHSGLSNGTFIRADETTNALVIIADPDTLNELENLVRQLDVRRSQVLIEAAIVEVGGNIDETLGLQWGYRGLSERDAPSVIGAAINASNISFGSVLMRNSNFGVLINALSSKSNINLMSTPSLMTLDNEESEFIVGQEVPFTTGSYQQNNTGANNPFTTTERKPVGLSLKVTPHIGEGNTLRLEIEQELSSLTQKTAREDGDKITSQRKLKTVVIVDNQETIVLGGILQDTVTLQTDKVPLLGDIPLFGRLFTTTRDAVEKKNLMLFLKPTIVRTGDDAKGITMNKYSRLRMIQTESAPDSLLESMPPVANDLFDKTPVQGE
jgi:general secretion pathway protein D